MASLVAPSLSVALNVDLVEDTWTDVEALPVADGYTAVVVNEKIYAVSGSNNYTRNYLYEYDPTENTWIEKKPVPTPRTSFALVACQNKIYVIGGSLGYYGNYSGVNEVYDPQTDMWETRKQMPTGRGEMNAESVGGKIYVIAGRTGGQSTTVNVTEVYDPQTDSWDSCSSIPYSVVYYASAVLDNKIYVIGGQAEYQDPPNGGFNQIYDPETDTWSQGARIPNPVWSGPKATTTNGADAPRRIYVIGGCTGFVNYTNSNYAYDPTTNSWTQHTSMQIARGSHALVTVNDFIYAIGGIIGWFEVTDSVERYTPIGYGTIPPVVELISPETTTYTTNEIPLEFTINKPVPWMGYSLDGKTNVTVTTNSTLEQLPKGNHNLTIYAKDANGNTGASITTYFDVTFDDFSEFSMVLVLIAIAVIIVGATFVIYYKKFRKHI
ncbi:MAG: hypothetical protein NWF03_03405 [Candidatus Bathyarchaeota archaeon]|nr:hypothetical protein [Candidatus Bathyarchaeota archaeon]